MAITTETSNVYIAPPSGQSYSISSASCLSHISAPASQAHNIRPTKSLSLATIMSFFLESPPKIHSPWYTAENVEISPFPTFAPNPKMAGVLPTVMNPASMRAVASWIRDDLDPLIAREGPDIMHPDDVLRLNELLQSLQVFYISKGDIIFSRIHLAIREIAGKASRWPYRLVEECDRVSKILLSSFFR